MPAHCAHMTVKLSQNARLHSMWYNGILSA